MAKSLGRSKKKEITEPKLFNGIGNYSKPKKMKRTVSKVSNKTNKAAHKQASERFRKITNRAKQIKDKHPKMKWKNAIRKASKELF